VQVRQLGFCMYVVLFQKIKKGNKNVDI